MVTIPNGKLADMNIETLAARDRLRLTMTLNINFGLKPQGLRGLREALIARIKEQPLVNKDKVKVLYGGLNERAITLEVTCWFETSDLDQFAEGRHNMVLAVLDVVDSQGAFAVPIQS